MDKEKKAKLDLALRDINKTLGKNTVKYGIDEKSKERMSFGVESLDEFTGGGSVCGNFSVVFGPKDCGKSTLMYHNIASAQKEGKICCYIDLEHTFSIERAEKFDINLDDLVLITGAECAEDAMDSIIKLAKAEVVDLIIVDSIQAMSSEAEQQTKKGKEKSVRDDTMAQLARKLSQFFRMCATPVYKANISVVLIGQVRTKGIGSFYTFDGLSGGNALEHWMILCVQLRQGQKDDSPQGKWKELFLDPAGKLHKVTKKEPIGFDCVARIEKAHISGSQPRGSTIHIPFYTDGGFNIPDEKEMQEKIVGTEEEQEKILEILANKSVKDACLKLADDKALTELAKDYLNAEDKVDKELIAKGKDVVKDFDMSKEVKVTPKKKGQFKGLKADKIILDEVMPEEPKPPKLRELKEGSMAPVKKKRGRPAKKGKK